MIVNRYSLTVTAEVIASRFQVDATEAYNPLYNAAPTHLLPVITSESQQGLSYFYWGAPPAWANKKQLTERIINTKSEDIPEKSVIRKKLRQHRCLIPADGFYGWKRVGKKGAVPYRFTRKDKSPFAMAGLWEEYDNENEERFHVFSLITTVANPSVNPIQERMPAILMAEHERDWLTLTEEVLLTKILNPYPESLEYYSVSSLVNQPDRNDRSIILPAAPADQFGNLSLFD